MQQYSDRMIALDYINVSCTYQQSLCSTKPCWSALWTTCWRRPTSLDPLSKIWRRTIKQTRQGHFVKKHVHSWHVNMFLWSLFPPCLVSTPLAVAQASEDLGGEHRQDRQGVWGSERAHGSGWGFIHWCVLFSDSQIFGDCQTVCLNRWFFSLFWTLDSSTPFTLKLFDVNPHMVQSVHLDGGSKRSPRWRLQLWCLILKCVQLTPS